MRLVHAAVLTALTVAGACSGESPRTAGPTPDEPRVSSNSAAPAPPPAPARNVRVAADPAPPFTYWAPEGSVIRNHPTNPGIWYAEIDGRRTGAHYFGDQCKASGLQGMVGQPLRSLPAPPPDHWRISCETCPVHQDLRPDRVNVKFDASDRITEVSCG